jgi:asparagine synthase (glutamine-hydrolysing)
MCGFAGVVAWDDRYRVDRAVLGRMSARIAHRGPDGEGVWLSHEGEVSAGRPQVGLVHRRLAIIDLDERANQPFTDGRGRWLAFNGEIYNYRELRRELEGVLPDWQWRTQSDTEVLLASYAAWGERCVEKLNGMFAFAVWDEGRGEVFLARDRMGQKPLYVSARLTDGTIGRLYGLQMSDLAVAGVAFGSEVQSVLPVQWVGDQLSESGLRNYLRYGFSPDSTTIYDAVCQVPQGYWCRFTRSGGSYGQYWSSLCGAGGQLRRSAPVPDGEAVVRVGEAVRRAVKRQLVADVPIGCFLSGGVDSSAIAASMKSAVGDAQAVMTFSMGFEDQRYDEREYARAVAGHLGTRHHEFVLRPNAAADLQAIARVVGQPFGDSSALPTYYLARETRRHVKVALSGDGGDELFGGYDRYRAMRLGRRVRTLTSPYPWKLGRPLASRLSAGHPKSTMTRVGRFAESLAFKPWHRYASYLELFDLRTWRALLGRDAGLDEYFGPMSEYFHAYSSILDPVESALAVDRETYLPYDLLEKVDRCSMAFALEVRSPFMDHELVECASSLTTRQLLKGGPKRMLREAFADALPAWVFKRKKMGFAVPIGEWFRGDLRPMLRDHLFASDSFAAGHFNTAVVRRLVEEHEAERVDHSQRLYALLMLELWWKGQKA